MEDNKCPSSEDAASALGSPKTESPANTLCEVAQKISSAALLINRAALIVQEYSSKKEQSGPRIWSKTTFLEERGTQTDKC